MDYQEKKNVGWGLVLSFVFLLDERLQSICRKWAGLKSVKLLEKSGICYEIEVFCFTGTRSYDILMYNYKKKMGLPIERVKVFLRGKVI